MLFIPFEGGHDIREMNLLLYFLIFGIRHFTKVSGKIQEEEEAKKSPKGESSGALNLQPAVFTFFI